MKKILALALALVMVFALCGVAWNRGDTYYWDPARKTLKAGDEITERSIPKGAMVFVRKD